MGLITQVNVEEGMSVESGQVLAKLDDVLANVSYDMALAQIDVHSALKKSTQVNLQEARRVHQRIIGNRFSSDAETTNALTRVQSLEADIERIEADMKVARIELERQKERLNDHTIRAPFAGVVTVKNAQPGEIVAPTSAGGGFTRTGICTIVDMNSLEIEVDVSESFIGRVFAGQRVEAKLDAYPDWKIPASVQVRIKLEINDARILPDMGVKVAFLKT
jgi:RND family efflux transporter MFP subunit